MLGNENINYLPAAAGNVWNYKRIYSILKYKLQLRYNVLVPTECLGNLQQSWIQ